jgi:hypothetical protein
MRLAFFGISLPVVQVGGGLIVISTGWALLKQRDDDDDTAMKRDIQSDDPFRHAFYPLTLPLTVGPGSISVAITLGADAPYHQGFHVLAILAAVVGGATRGQYFPVLRIRGPVGAVLGSHRDDRDRAADVVSAGMHRCADSVERSQHSVGFGAVACSVSRVSGWDCLRRGTHSKRPEMKWAL